MSIPNNGRHPDHAAPQPEMSAVPVQPVPTQIQVVQGPPLADGKPTVVVIVSTPVGTSVYFIDGNMATLLGGGLQRLGAASASGIVLPT